MIEIKAISVDKKIDAECKLIKSSVCIHPKNHKRVMMSIYFEIYNKCDIPIEEITFYFSSLINLEIEDKTKTYSTKYRKFIGANLDPENHPADYLQGGTPARRIVVKYDDPILPRKIGSTLFKLEFERHSDRRSLLRKIMGHGDVWKFELWTWRKPKLMRNHKLLNVKGEDIWVMIPKTLYRSSEFLHSNPGSKLSRLLTQEEIDEGRYNKEWVHPDTYCLNWSVQNENPMIPRQQTYSIRYTAQIVPFVSLISLFASITALLSLGMNIGSMTFLGQYIYLLIALIVILLTLLATIYSYS